MIPDFAQLVRANNPGPMTLDGTNTWLLRDGANWLVIDPGPLLDEHLDHLVAATDSRVSHILLTHGHPDHAEGALKFAEIVGSPIRATDRAHLHGADQLADGEEIVIGSGRLTVLTTPGHTGDSTSFLMRSNDQAALLTGDTILGRGTTVLIPPDGTLAGYLESLDRLEGIAADLNHQGIAISVLPGHGPVHADAVSLIAFYIDHRQERLDQVRAHLCEGITDAQELVNWIYADVPENVKAAALMSVQAQLEYLNQS